MHLLKNTPKKDAPLIPIVSQWKVPGVRKMRGRRYRDGVDIGPCGPPKPVPDVAAIMAVKKAYAEAAKKGRPTEGGGFDLNTLKLTSGRELVTRGQLIKEEGGIELPEAQWKHAPGWIVLRVAPDVKSIGVGDRVLLQAKHKAKPVDLGGCRFFLTRAAVVVGIVEVADPV
jgi:hypothetical protein